jgi:hypothetical protein
MDTDYFNESGGVDETLEDGIEEACVAIIVKATTHIGRPFNPGMTDFGGV